jgi:hypothetical protein
MTEQQFQSNSYAAANAAMLDGFAPETAALVQSALDDGEQILWTGKPDPWTLFNKNLPLLCIAVGWWFVSIFAGPPGVWLLTTPILIIGIGSLWFVNWQQAQKSVWLLTNQRAIEACSFKGWRYQVNSYFYHRHIRRSIIKVKSKTDGSGTLSFATAYDLRNYFDTKAQFLNAPNVVHVKQIMEDSIDRNAHNPLGQIRLRLQQTVVPQLHSDEKVVWAAMPDRFWLKASLQAKTLSKATWLLGIVAMLILMLIGFDAVFASRGWSFRFLRDIPLSTVIPIAVLLGAMTILSIGNSEKRSEQAAGNADLIGYVITDRRFIRLDASGSEPKIEVYNNADIGASKLKCVKHKDGTGDIHLQLRGEYSAKFSFFGVHEPEKVKGIIEDVVADAQRKPA